jgi:type IV secretory pathway VirB10-like protein
VDQTAIELAKLRAQLAAQQQAIEELRRRSAVRAVVTTPPPPAAPRLALSSMLYVAHELPAGAASAKSAAPTYTLAPGATKLACQIETAMNSDVEGYFTAKVSTNVYDTATGRHLLVPQGSTILGHDQSSALLYGNERLPTISLTLALPDGRSVELGQAPVTDQQGVAGLTGQVNNHWWRLFGAVFIGGALRGGTQALQLGLAQAGPTGQVAGGIGATGAQVTQQRLGRALDTRPTITVDSGQLCQVLLTKPLTPCPRCGSKGTPGPGHTGSQGRWGGTAPPSDSHRGGEAPASGCPV